MDGSLRDTIHEPLDDRRTSDRALQRRMLRAVWTGLGCWITTLLWYWLRLWIPWALCLGLGACCLYQAWIWSWVRGKSSIPWSGAGPSPEATSTIAFLRVSGTLVAVFSIFCGLIAGLMAPIYGVMTTDLSAEEESVKNLFVWIFPLSCVIFGGFVAVTTHTGIQILKKK